jgi:hypothetical protein
MALELELETYQKNLSSLLTNKGRFVLIAGDRVEGVFDHYKEAIEIGYQRFGLNPFLVKQIQEPSQPVFFSRDVQ